MNTKRKGKNLIAIGITLVIALTLFSVPMTAFAADSTTTKVTAENAKEIALTTVGGGTVTKCESDYENGRNVYDITIIYGDKKYEMDVDKATGAVSDYKVKTINQDGSATTSSNSGKSSSVSQSGNSQSAASSAGITDERAKQIALARVGGGTVTECKTDYERRRLVYEVEIRYNGWEYEIDVDAATGEIVKYEIDD